MKATYIGPDIVRMKAEIDIDGSVIASQYLDSLPKAELSEQIEWIVQQETLEQVHCFEIYGGSNFCLHFFFLQNRAFCKIL
jgi:hypothetical protein